MTLTEPSYHTLSFEEFPQESLAVFLVKNVSNTGYEDVYFLFIASTIDRRAYLTLFSHLL